MEREKILSEIAYKLAVFEAEVKIANSNGEYNINLHAENMLIPILNLVYDCAFQNLNYVEKKTFPAIDLGDPHKHIAVQITSTGTTAKVAHSLELFNKYDQGKTYSEFLFYFLQEPGNAISMSTKSIVSNLGSLSVNNIHFLSNKELYKILNTFDIEQLKKALEILKKEYPDVPQNRSAAIALTPFPSYDHEAGLIGRDSLISDIKRVLENSFPVVVLNGPGGIGKTSVAAKICHDIKAENRASIAWITYSGNLKDDLLELELFNDQNSIQRQDRIQEYMKITNDSLYVFIDNVRTRLSQNDIELINQFAHSIRVIITSRNRINAFQCIRLTALKKEEAVAMYEAYSHSIVPSNQMDTFERLLTHISANTLVLELLAKYAFRKFLTLQALIKRLESQGIPAMDTDNLETIYSEKPMAIRDFLLKLYDMSELSDEQKRIMKLLSIFPAEKTLPLYVANWAAFDMAELSTLSEWGWIKHTKTATYLDTKQEKHLEINSLLAAQDINPANLPSRLYLHSIVRDAVSSQSKELIRFSDYGVLLKKVTDTFNYLARSTDYMTTRKDIILPEAIAEYRLLYKMNDEATAKLCLNLSYTCRRIGDVTKAEKYIKKARSIYQKISGKESSQMARVLKQYAYVRSDQGLLDQALLLAHQSLAIRKALEDQAAIASSYDLLGSICIKKEDYDNALFYLKEALSIREKFNPKATDTANTLHNLGIVFSRTLHAENAIECFKGALVIRRELLGENHLQTASTLSRLGDTYLSIKDYEDALTNYEKAYKIFEILSAVEHPFAESTYFGLGYCYMELGESNKAADAFEKAYKICLTEYGPDHPQTIEAQKQMQ